MGETKKILVSLPDSLLREVDKIVAMEKKNRSEFIRESMKLYLREKNRIKIRRQMEVGYQEMGTLNRAFAEEAVEADTRVFNEYEDHLSECE